MRIVSGRFRGRRFSPPSGKYPTRPTTDMARESLFNILQNELDFEETKALELFGGFGGCTYELVSRGCADATIVERHGGCVRFIKDTCGILGITEQVRVIRGDAFGFLKGLSLSFDYIFADPPYQLPTLELLPELVFERELLKPGGLFVLEHGIQYDFTQHPRFQQERKYGGAVFSFFVGGNSIIFK